MIPGFPSFRKNVTLLGGGECSRATVDKVLTLAPHLVAADGAAARALALGHAPEAVIGDLDSLDAATRAKLAPGIVHRIDDQHSTDFDKALRSINAPLVLGVGFMGARLDHELACYNSLVRWPDRKCILVGEHDICFHVPSRLELSLAPGSRLSLFPMAGLRANARGLVWPVEAMPMAPWGRVGTSNAVDAGGHVSLEFDRPGMLVILPRAGLRAAVAAVAAGG